ncbi:hypothetical protein SORBI_3010G167700 [Sorghum bicolor]|uniref:Protein kinase domain-containing protein n=1 Tax=Sorghum bicolor TaxID=4558 RepID=A0A194YJN6_SORBI|nr:hypothetical protein SORBI_3010G167700 [Sorghum bicolor]
MASLYLARGILMLTLVLLNIHILKSNCESITRDSEKAELIKLEQDWGKPLIWEHPKYNLPASWSSINNYFNERYPAEPGNLSELQVLYLAYNPFAPGRMHPQFGNLSNIKYLWMSNMNIVGEIPDIMPQLSQLRLLDLSSNRWNGMIPSGVWTLRSLEMLYLDNNSLCGHISGPIEAMSLTEINVSNNLLTGRIPDDFGKQFLWFTAKLRSNITTINISNNRFSGSLPMSADNLNTLMAENNFISGEVPTNLINGAPLQINEFVRSFLSNPGLCASYNFGNYPMCIRQPGILCFIKIRAFLTRQRQNHEAPSPGWNLTTFQPINYNVEDILYGLTNNNLVGSGGSGKVYKICLGNSCKIAVKKISNGLKKDDMMAKQFQAEIGTLGSIRHANIVKLLDFISTSESKLLIYEYMEHAHRDVKSSNILLDLEFKAKIADFGLARALVKAGDLESISTMVGSFGYMAPEFASIRKINVKVDVYSFGVVLLELTTRRLATGEDGGHENLAQWAWRKFQEDNFQLIDVIDENMRDASNFREVQLVFKLGLICTGPKPSLRPTMKEVLQVLQH